MPNSISVTEASDQTGIPKRTIQHAITTGRLKARKLSGATAPFLIEPADLDNWLASRASA